jgi:ABC-type multidrug transport system fused ATPase/permease subunit
LENGVYTIFAEAINLKGAKSNPSEKVVILITPPAFIRIGGIIIDYLSLSIIILVLGAVVIFEILWIFKKVRQTRRNLEKETREVEQALYQAFKTLRKEIREQVIKLDGKPSLSEREKEILDGFKKALKDSEKFISKEIKDIEKELK